MNTNMRTLRLLPLLLAASILGVEARAQASLSAIDATLTIDFGTTVPGVNNGTFEAATEAGSLTPAPGQLDLNAWDYLADGTTAQALSASSAFPGTLPPGNGFAAGGALATGLNATEVNGARALGIQPTGGHFTAGSITLHVRNNTGQALTRLDVAYLVGVFNDRDRSNSFTLLWSVDNTQGSYVAVPATAVVSPGPLDASPEWAVTPVSTQLTGFNVPDGGSFYLRWVGDDVDGAGQRDEFALTGIALTPRAVSGPVLIASTTALPPFSQTLGTPSAPQAFTLSGQGLTGEVRLTVTPPYQISLNAGSGYVGNIELDPVAGSLAGTTIHVRLNNTVAGPSTGTVTAASAGANSPVVNLSGNTTPTGLPVLFINELLASNATGITDENGEYDDWFEIFNPNGFDVDLAGWYVSDDPSNPIRYRFDPTAADAVVPANGWLLIWADNQTAQGNLHTNFALSASGESVILTAPDGTTTVDRIDFGPQTADVSYGRATDGGTPWVFFTVPTPGASNNPTAGIADRDGHGPLRAWPVPATTILNLDRPVTGIVLDLQGRVAGNVSRTSAVDVGHLVPGVYLLRAERGEVLRFVKE